MNRRQFIAAGSACYALSATASAKAVLGPTTPLAADSMMALKGRTLSCADQRARIADVRTLSSDPRLEQYEVSLEFCGPVESGTVSLRHPDTGKRIDLYVQSSGQNKATAHISRLI